MAIHYPTRNGFRLCSWHNPWGEGKAWAQSQHVLPQSKAVLVLGLGCGFHLEALADLFPDLKIFVSDPFFDTEYFFNDRVRNQRIQLVKEPDLKMLFSEVDVLLKFLPALQGGELEADAFYQKCLLGMAVSHQQTHRSRGDLELILKELVR